MLRLACLALVVAVAVLLMENRGLKTALANLDNGYVELMGKRAGDGTLGDLIRPGTIGIFGLGDSVVGCAILKSVPLPAASRRAAPAPSASAPASDLAGGSCAAASLAAAKTPR